MTERFIHILRTTKGWTRWRIASDWYSNIRPDDMIFVGCCACNVRADQAKVRIERVKNHMQYFEPIHQVVCRAGKGCNANPKKRRGMALREWAHYG